MVCKFWGVGIRRDQREWFSRMALIIGKSNMEHAFCLPATFATSGMAVACCSSLPAFVISALLAAIWQPLASLEAARVTIDCLGVPCRKVWLSRCSFQYEPRYRDTDRRGNLCNGFENLRQSIAAQVENRSIHTSGKMNLGGQGPI